MTITDQFGRAYKQIEDFTPATVADEVALYAEETDRYLGLATKWRGIGWTHSLHYFGEPAVAGLGDVVVDFKEKLARRGAAADRHYRWVRIEPTRGDRPSPAREG